MTIYNHKFAKPAADGTPLYGPMPLGLEIPHHEEWDEPVVDPETGEPTGETEHKTRDWVEKRTVVHPKAKHFKLMGYMPPVDKPPPDPPQGWHYKRTGKIAYSPDGQSVVAQYALVPDTPPPPRRWTRLSIKGALADAHLLPAAQSYLTALLVKPDYPAWAALSDCDYIEEGYGGAEAWDALLDGAASALGKTREEIDAFLDSIPTEGGV